MKKKVGVPILARLLAPIATESSGTKAAPVKRRGRLWKFAFGVLVAIGLAAGGIAIIRRAEWLNVAKQLSTFEGLAERWRPPVLPSLLVVGIIVILLLWKLPKWQVARSKALTDEKRFDRENEARKTLAQILAGVFVLVGLYSSLESTDM